MVEIGCALVLVAVAVANGDWAVGAAPAAPAAPAGPAVAAANTFGIFGDSDLHVATAAYLPMWLGVPIGTLAYAAPSLLPSERHGPCRPSVAD
jgi:hypothetical protein